MAKKENTTPDVQCENADMELLRRKLIQIEKLLADNHTEQKELIDRIPTTPMVMPPVEPQPIVMPEINIPMDIAKQSDINTLVEMVVALNSSVEQEVRTLSELKKMLEEQNKEVIRVLQESGKISDETIDAISKRLAEGYKPSVNDAIIQGVIEGKLKSPGISLTNAEAIHSDIMDIKQEISVRDQCDKIQKENKWLWIVCIVLFNLLCVAGFWIKWLYGTQETLVRTEWLYRWKRATQPDSQDFQFFENTGLNGSKEQRHEIYRKII